MICNSNPFSQKKKKKKKKKTKKKKQKTKNHLIINHFLYECDKYYIDYNELFTCENVRVFF